MPDERRVVRTDGCAGFVVATHGDRSELHFDGEPPLLVPSQSLVPDPDGGFRLDLDARSADETVVVPLVAEQVTVGKRTVETGVRLVKTVTERDVTVDEPLRRDKIEVHRVPINRLVETAPPARQEGDTLIFSLVEEVLVVEKRLMLREEVHLVTQRETVHEPQTVTLRREEATVELIEPQNVSPESGTPPASTRSGDNA